MTLTSFSYAGTELDALSEAGNYYRWILSQLAPFLGKRVIEVGAGIGTFSGLLLNSTNVSELVLVEPADNLFALLQQRFCGNSRVKLVHGYLGDLCTRAQLSADSVVLVNLLEHIVDDEACLRDAHQLLVPGGIISLLVPALPQLYGSLDEAFGHVRRYTKSLLASRLRQAGFDLVCLRYFNFPGVMTWFVTSRVLRWRTLRPAGIRLYDRCVVGWLSRLERYWEPPIGQSLIAIARK